MTLSAASIVRKATKAAVLPFGVLDPARQGDVVILLYHRVGAGDREVDLGIRAFGEQLAYLGGRDDVRCLDDALDADGHGGVVVTVDDGTPDFHEHVVPLLVKHRVPALLYLATGLVADVARGPRGEDALTWSQLAEALSTGLVTIGAHTHDHTNLSHATERAAEEEMRRSKELVEERLGVACRHFAYPWAVASAGAERVARRLFRTAALRWGTNRWGGIDRYRLARAPVLRSDGRTFFRAKVRGMLDGEALVYRVARRGPWRAA